MPTIRWPGVVGRVRKGNEPYRGTTLPRVKLAAERLGRTEHTRPGPPQRRPKLAAPPRSSIFPSRKIPNALSKPEVETKTVVLGYRDR